MKLKRIYHIADIHYRNVKRHNEYRYVLTKFLESVKSIGTEDSIIYIAGDIAHAKLEMSPELVNEISWFLTECSVLCPTVVIAGNHDCNMANLDRLDVLTPIISALNNPNILYLRDTSVTNIGGVLFSTFSVFDNKANWKYANSPEMVGDLKKIALFHGPIDASVTDIGFTVNSSNFNANMFDGFDAALLGDIHKRQELVSKSGCKVVYAGSIIQQNYGESTHGHGFLVWDVDSMTYDAYDIHNPYAYYTVDVVDGSFNSNIQVPSTARVRLRILDSGIYDTKRLIYDAKSAFGVFDVTVIRRQSIITNTYESSDVTATDLSDINVQFNMILDYIKETSDVNAADIETLRNLHTTIHDTLNLSDSTIFRKWIPIRFEFENMFSYGTSNVIDFTNLSGLIGVFGPNAIGKSSIFDAISVCLFDKCSRAFKASHIMNSDKDSFKCKLDFIANGTLFTIERSANRTSRDKKVKVDVNFYRTVNGIVENLNGADRRDTNAVIQGYVGTYDDFILTTLSLQNNNSLFIDKGQTERKELLAQFMGLNIFDKLYTAASDIYKENSTLIRGYNIDQMSSKLYELQSQVAIKQELLRSYNNQIENNNTSLRECNDKLIELHSSILKIEDVDAIDMISRKLDTELSTKSILESKLHTIESDIVDINNKINSIQSDMDSIPYTIDVLTDTHSDYLSTNTLLVKTKSSIDLLAVTIDNTREKIAHLDLHQYDPNCPYCMDNVFVKDALQMKSNIVHLETEMQKLQDTHSDILNKINKLEVYVEHYKSYNTFHSKKRTLDMELLTKTTKRSEIRTKLNNCNVLIDSLEKQKQIYYDNKSAILHNDSVSAEITKITSTKKSIEVNQSTLNSKLLQHSTELGSIMSSISNLELSIKKYNEIFTLNSIYTKYIDAVNRDNLPYQMIYNILPVLESEINSILNQIVDFTMQLEMDGKNINAKILYTDKEWPLEMSSGMERFISGIAIRVALIGMCALPKPNFMVLDEGLGTLDSDNLSSIFSLLHYLKHKFEFVWIISHIDTVRDVVDSQVEIKKKHGYSFVTT
jgi:DNA repair exonuclease SbcCD nuclease subunit/ABC-type lipopolysaccharide export system ATPase subunit/predicted  nucleic acid-binding Zn-ribbon protein